MIEYERIDISQSIDINKTNKSKECMLCHYWYFLNKNFSDGPYLCHGCYNIMQKSVDSKKARKNLPKTLIFITLITFKKILIIVTHCV